MPRGPLYTPPEVIEQLRGFALAKTTAAVTARTMFMGERRVRLLAIEHGIAFIDGRSARGDAQKVEEGIRQAHSDGLTVPETAKRLEISEYRIRWQAARLGLTFVHGNTRPQREIPKPPRKSRAKPTYRRPPPPTEAQRHWAGMKAQFRW